MNNVYPAMVALFFLNLSGIAHAQEQTAMTTSAMCAPELCLSVLMDTPGKPITSVDLYPIMGGSKGGAHGRTDMAFALPNEVNEVVLKVASTSASSGVVCLAVRDEQGNMLSVPDGSIVRDEASSVPDFSLEHVRIDNWERCDLFSGSGYLLFRHSGDRKFINLVKTPLTRQTRASLILAYFPISLAQEEGWLPISIGEKTISARPTPSSVIRAYVGNDELNPMQILPTKALSASITPQK